MKLLLDTHTFLWFINDSPQLSADAKSILEADSELLLSTASLWEIAIKISIGKLTLPQPYNMFIPEQLAINSIKELPINLKHLDVISALAFPHHDPFDRLLIAQAITESLPIVSADAAFDFYSVKRLW
jgi:PIN domain nuclease of toxin-antitoxin system